MSTARTATEQALTQGEHAERRAADLTACLALTVEDRDAIGAELNRVLATRTMRWSRRARLLYGRLRALA